VNHPQNPSSPRRVLRTREAAQYVGLSVSWLRKKRLRGADDPGEPGPEYIRISPLVVVYEISALDRWLDQHRGRTDAVHARVA
jgi:predicted DNA-binding transcriptional regulator AlpA